MNTELKNGIIAGLRRGKAFPIWIATCWLASIAILLSMWLPVHATHQSVNGGTLIRHTSSVSFHETTTPRVATHPHR